MEIALEFQDQLSCCLVEGQAEKFFSNLLQIMSDHVKGCSAFLGTIAKEAQFCLEAVSIDGALEVNDVKHLLL